MLFSPPFPPWTQDTTHGRGLLGESSCRIGDITSPPPQRQDPTQNAWSQGFACLGCLASVEGYSGG